MDFAPKPGCPMCGIVSTARLSSQGVDRVLSPVSSPSSPLTAASAPDVLWRDDNFTVYRERANPISSIAHIIIAFNLHVPSLYTLSSSDVPLLTSLKSLASRHLGAVYAAQSTRTPTSSSFATGTTTLPPNVRWCVGFITPPFKDTKIPVTDHLHAHAYILPADLLGWWRGVAYSSVAWYELDDLIAEIRESTSNNRVKSGYEDRKNAPIDTVPQAGARMGTSYGHETTEAGVASADLEAGETQLSRVPTPMITLSPPRSSSSSSRPPSASLSPPPRPF